MISIWPTPRIRIICAAEKFQHCRKSKDRLWASWGMKTGFFQARQELGAESSVSSSYLSSKQSMVNIGPATLHSVPGQSECVLFHLKEEACRYLSRWGTRVANSEGGDTWRFEVDCRGQDLVREP